MLLRLPRSLLRSVGAGVVCLAALQSCVVPVSGWCAIDAWSWTLTSATSVAAGHGGDTAYGVASLNGYGVEQGTNGVSNVPTPSCFKTGNGNVCGAAVTSVHGQHFPGVTVSSLCDASTCDPSNMYLSWESEIVDSSVVFKIVINDYYLATTGQWVQLPSTYTSTATSFAATMGGTFPANAATLGAYSATGVCSANYCADPTNAGGLAFLTGIIGRNSTLMTHYNEPIWTIKVPSFNCSDKASNYAILLDSHSDCGPQAAFTAVVNSCPAPASSSSTASHTSMYSDPFFVGFWNQAFYVHGRHGAVYSLLSDRHVSLNSRFVFLTNITCPTLSPEEMSRPAKVHCSSHEGTYFGEMGLTTADGDQLYIAAGNVTTGFHIVTVNGQLDIDVGDSYGAAPLAAIPHDQHTGTVSAATADSHSHPARTSLYVHRTSARSLVVHAGLYELLIENSDNYVDVVTLHVTSWPALLEDVQPTGLMGVTWNMSAVIPPSEEAHRERDGELMGCSIANDKFCASASKAQQQQHRHQQ